MANNPYLDQKWKDRTNDVDKFKAGLLIHIKHNPDAYAEVIADLYFHWKQNTFETEKMVALHSLANFVLNND